MVRPTGTKVWQYPYIYNGKANIFTIGQYPDILPAEARKKRDEVKKLLSAGKEPNTEKILAKRRAVQASSDSRFETIAREWHSKQLWAEKHAKNILSRLEKDVFPHIGMMIMDNIKASDIVHVLQYVEERGALDVAHRLGQYMNAIFDYGLVSRNPRRRRQGRAHRRSTAATGDRGRWSLSTSMFSSNRGDMEASFLGEGDCFCRWLGCASWLSHSDNWAHTLFAVDILMRHGY
ncbi:MAG: DUF4102 domain-containing protein [Alphaproteobacteria bacterium]|nr:DUF4102 domain-containing protein [Alphaproteobacteria bacterium]